MIRFFCLSDSSDSNYDSESEQVEAITLRNKMVFGHEGGTLDVPKSSVSIRVPKGAIALGETKEIDVKVKLCRPNDWKCMGKDGYTIDLPQVELGPNGSKFNKPIEVLFENNTAFGVQDDVLFEYTEGSIDKNSKWLPAVKCKTRKEAKSSALNVAPHVAFVAGNKYLHAFYLHFTGGRRKKKIPKYKWLQSVAYLKTGSLLGLNVALKVVFYEATPEGKEVNEILFISLFPSSVNLCYINLFTL